MVALEETIDTAEPIATIAPLEEFLEPSTPEPFRYCLNTSTLRGFSLTLDQLVDIAAAAGYEAIEPWVDELDRFEADGGDLRALGGRIRDLGLTVESAIGFFNWVDDDPQVRETGLLEARRSMAAVARIGGQAIAAPAFGVHSAGSPTIHLGDAAARYHRLCDIGDEMGVRPLLELWGFSANLSRVGDVLFVAAESGHASASLLLDIYHLYKGGSPVSSLRLLSSEAVGLFHVNDYPAIAPSEITDADRVYPGDGVAPLGEALRLLHRIGYQGALSLELFNPSYWQQEPLLVAKTGLVKLKAVVDASL
jgi:sugar phosphate isomerase/epimerase